MKPEWNLDEGEADSGSYRFTNVNPKIVFLLALAAALIAVAMVYAGYLLVNMAMASGMIPHPPRLQGLVA